MIQDFVSNLMNEEVKQLLFHMNDCQCLVFFWEICFETKFMEEKGKINQSCSLMMSCVGKNASFEQKHVFGQRLELWVINFRNDLSFSKCHLVNGYFDPHVPQYDRNMNKKFELRNMFRSELS